MFRVIVSFRQRDEVGNEQGYEAVKIVEGVCFERSGTPPRIGGRLRFWHTDAPAILLAADVVPDTHKTSVIKAVPGDEWVDAGEDAALTPLLAPDSQAAFMGHLKKIGLKLRPCSR